MGRQIGTGGFPAIEDTSSDAEVQDQFRHPTSALDTLRGLANAADGLSFRETEIRQIVGNTNWSVLRHWINEARAVLNQEPQP